MLVWNAIDPTTSSSAHQVQVRPQPASGSPGSILTLSPLGEVASFPAVDADDDGDAAAVWREGATVVGRRISASGSLVGTAQTLSTSAPTSSPVVAVAPGGTALAAWSESRDGTWYAVARRLGDDGTVGPAITLGPSTGDYPDIDVDRNGRFVVAWVQGNIAVHAARIEADSVTSTQVLTSSISSYRPFGLVKVGVDADGDAVISHLSGGGGSVQVWASRWSGSGTLDDPINVSSPTDNSGLLHTLATDLEGDSILVWTRTNSDNRVELLGRQLSRTGTLGAITNLGEGDQPEIALDDDGDGVVVFHTPSRPYEAHEVGARPISTSGSFGSTTTLTSDGRSPYVDANPSSRFTVIWQKASDPYSIHAATGSSRTTE